MHEISCKMISNGSKLLWQSYSNLYNSCNKLFLCRVIPRILYVSDIYIISTNSRISTWILLRIGKWISIKVVYCIFYACKQWKHTTEYIIIKSLLLQNFSWIKSGFHRHEKLYSIVGVCVSVIWKSVHRIFMFSTLILFTFYLVFFSYSCFIIE